MNLTTLSMVMGPCFNETTNYARIFGPGFNLLIGPRSTFISEVLVYQKSGVKLSHLLRSRGGLMNKNDKLVRNVGIGVFILMLTLSFLMSGSGDSEGSGVSINVKNPFEGIPLQKTTASDSGSLPASRSFIMEISEEGSMIKNVTARLSWTDESSPPGLPRVRRYENQPDTFSLHIIAPDGNSTDVRGKNPAGGSGDLEVIFSLEDEVLAQLMEQSNETAWSVMVTMEDAGMWKPMLGPGLIGLTDSGNDFSLSVDYEYYNMAADEEEE